MGNLKYIGVLKEILVVDYACLPMVLFTCSWIPTNTQGNATICQDEHGFWVVNLACRLPPMVKPYVFPTSMIQVKAWVTPYVLIMNKYMTYNITRLLKMGKNQWRPVWILDVVITIFNYNVIKMFDDSTCMVNNAYGNVGVLCFRHCCQWRLANGVAKIAT
jgi:hypothetical protein